MSYIVSSDTLTPPPDLAKLLAGMSTARRKLMPNPLTNSLRIFGIHIGDGVANDGQQKDGYDNMHTYDGQKFRTKY